MQKNEPKYSALGSAVNNQSNKTWSSVYVQSKSFEATLVAGTNFLYCEYFVQQNFDNHSHLSSTIIIIFIGAYSEFVTVYCEEYDVKNVCKESEFVKSNIRGHRTEWIRYSYFEFTRHVYIKPHQKVIVKKKVGLLAYSLHRYRPQGS